MADKKISALTAATTPLDGTEVLPIVQSGATKKVANNDLRPRQIQSNATSGVLQIAGPAAGATRVMTTPDANFTAARTDAANSFSGNQTLSDGDLVVGTAGKGIDFSANGGDVLSQYDEGTWVPVVTASSGAITSYTSSGSYTRIGRMVTATINAKVTDAGTGSGALISTLPFASNAALVYTCAGRDDNTGLAIQGRIQTATPTTVYIVSYSNTSVVLTNTEVFVTITYFV